MKMMNYVKITYMSAIPLMILSFILFSMSTHFILNDYEIFMEWEITSLNSSSIMMVLYLDWIALMFASTVLIISSMILMYSQGYMSHDKYLQRFIMIVLIFVASMLFLIISPNMMSILIGWDGLGLVSYCLVIYYQSNKSFNAGMLTALTNRIGDIMILMTIICMFQMGSWNFMFYINTPIMKMNLMIMFLILIASLTKSAQIPFSAWLPAAMAAPTPVSSLVHSSTLVTAGVFLLIRFNKELMNSNLSKMLLMTGTLTMFMASMAANFENDLKKIIALSTLSQLGLMMSILAMGYPNLALFHLMTHALFKALLFMCAGHIIYSMMDNQDIRRMGSISKTMPMTISCFMLANLSLCGMPFMAGFYSKDLILEMVIMNEINYIPYLLFFISTGLTVSYTTRLTKSALTLNFKGIPLMSWANKDWMMVLPIMNLSILALLGGSLMSWLILPTPPTMPMPFHLKMLTSSTILIGVMIGSILIYVPNNIWKIKHKPFMKYLWFSTDMWFLPLISTLSTIKHPMKYSINYKKLWDQGWNEFIMPQGMFKTLIKMSNHTETWQMTSSKSIIYIMMIMFTMYIMLYTL
uniref:NADH dehydrogenase subunit 5 n=1 Tax=Haplodiplatys aotouensis TaxID=2962943 RepID=UPI0021141B3C|nr:NADH dehydrogenase subunit 5 [Haplodiplatys aotouensis]UTI38884.1 NADH dehydrogenase subunit 5 [Haplodiplatys aotouensis]UTI38897.1 NADH dehydrogenase subunit 5 [Haplodiplatys aotouensis]